MAKENGHSIWVRPMNRRTVLRGAGALVVTAAVGDELGLSPQNVKHYTELTVTYGPDVAMAFAKNPGQFPKDSWALYFKLWKKPEETYKKSPYLSAPLQYSPVVPTNLDVIAFGDSNMVGPNGKDRNNSAVALFQNKVAQNGYPKWREFNLAESGYTTQMVADTQLERGRKLLSPNPSDIWLSAGGNDFWRIVKNRQEVEELAQLAKNPFDDINLLLKYTKRIEESLKLFEEGFAHLLDAVNRQYKGTMQNLVVVSAPNFSDAPAVTTQPLEDGKPYRIPLESSASRRIVGNAGTLINNSMFNVLEEFDKHEGVRIVGIDATKPSISQFVTDQHLSPQAYEVIAEEAFQRMPRN